MIGPATRLNWPLLNTAFVASAVGPTGAPFPLQPSTFEPTSAGVRVEYGAALGSLDALLDPRGDADPQLCGEEGGVCITLPSLGSPEECAEKALLLVDSCAQPNAKPVAPPEAEPILDPLIFYRLRDRILCYTPGGRRAIDLFFGSLLDTADTTFLSADAAELALDWAKGWQPLLRLLVHGRGDAATVTQGHAQLLIDYVASLKAAATQPTSSTPSSSRRLASTSRAGSDST